jgi:hypothetical protein
MEARVRATGHIEGTWAESVEILGVMLMLVVAEPANQIAVRGRSDLKLLQIRSGSKGIVAIVSGGPLTMAMAGIGDDGERELSRLGWQEPTSELASWSRSWDRMESLGTVARSVLVALRGAFGVNPSCITCEIFQSGL